MREHQRTTVRGFDVDTIRVTDSALPYETAVFRNEPVVGGVRYSRVVECYSTWLEAEVGHHRWVELVKTAPNFKLEDVEDQGTNPISILSRILFPKEKN